MSPFARGRGVAAAFLDIGMRNALGYPMSFLMAQMNAVLGVFIFFFVDRVVEPTGPGIGADYFTFVVVALVGMQVLAAGLQGFSQELEYAINQGRFEILLTEPVPWRLIPLAMMQFPALIRLVSAASVFAIAIPLGANYRWAGLPMAIGVGVLGVLAGASIGLLAASIKVLAKRGDPVLAVYALVAQIFAGVYFPLETIPTVLRPISWALPNTYVIGAMRDTLLPGGAPAGGPSGATAIIGLLIFTLVVFPIAIWAFGRALTFGRRMGLLGSY